MTNFAKKIYKKIIIFLFLIIYGYVYFNNQKLFFKEKILLKFKKKKYNYHLYNIKNARIYTDSLYCVSYIKNHLLIRDISKQFNTQGLSLNLKKSQVLKYGTPKLKKKIQGKILSIIQGASGHNYFHWLYDILPKIYLIHLKKKIKYFDYFYVPKIYQRFQYETLKYFGINKSKLIDSDKFKHVEAKNIFTIEHPYHNKKFWWDSFNSIPSWIVNFLRNFLKYKKKFKCKKKIYIDRTDTKSIHNQIINNKELINFLKSKGFEIYKLASLPFNKQIYLFFNAKIIIGAHGAGLANICFCKKKTLIIDLKSKQFKKNQLYKKISKINNLNYLSLICPSNNKKQMSVNINILNKLL